MNIRELSELTGTAERQIRYMIAEGFVPPPTGGRAHADYGDEHVDAIRRYLALKARGFAPHAIKALLSDGMTVPFPVLPGITLHVEAHLMGVMDAEALADRIRQAVGEILKEPFDAESSHDTNRRSRKPRRP